MFKFIVLYLLICYFYAFSWSHKSKQEAIYSFVIAFFIPVAGLLYLLSLDSINIFSGKQSIDYESLNLEEALFAKSRSSLPNKIDYETETNIIPFDDALLIGSEQIKKKAILDMLKEDTVTYVEFLEKALNDSSTDSAHYAAAGLSDMQSKLSSQLQDLSLKYENDNSNEETLVLYADVLQKYLSSTMLDDKHRQRYMRAYSKVLVDLLKIEPQNEYFIKKIQCDIALCKFDSAKKYCRAFLSFDRSSEKPYLMLLEYYYRVNDHRNFHKTLRGLKRSHISFSNECVTLVRFWAEGV